MACFGQDYYEEAVDNCPECGAEIDKDGDAVQCCSYSEELCSKCGHRPCDQSC